MAYVWSGRPFNYADMDETDRCILIRAQAEILVKDLDPVEILPYMLGSIAEAEKEEIRSKVSMWVMWHRKLFFCVSLPSRSAMQQQKWFGIICLVIEEQLLIVSYTFALV